MSSSEEPIKANDGRAGIPRPVTVGSATATFAARLATLPTPSSIHESTPLRPPVRESASSSGVDAATIIPSTGSGVNAARLAMQLDQEMHMHVGDRTGDQR